MWRRKLFAVISSSSASPRSNHAAERTSRVKHVVLRLRRRERAEVVLPDQEIGGVGERVVVERVRVPVAAVCSNGDGVGRRQIR